MLSMALRPPLPLLLIPFFWNVLRFLASGRALRYRAARRCPSLDAKLLEFLDRLRLSFRLGLGQRAIK